MIINSIAYQQGKRVREIALEDISDVLKDGEFSQGAKALGSFIWLGLHEPDEPMLAKIQEEFQLHDLAIEDAHHAHQRPKLETYGDSIFMVLKTAHPGAYQVIYGETHLFMGAHFLVSVRHGCPTGYTKVRARCEANPEMLKKGPGFALYALIDFIVDHYHAIMTQLEADFNELEVDIFKGEFDREVIEKVYDLKRELLMLRNAALPVNEMCNELMRFHEDIVPKELRVYFRDVQDHVTRLVSSVDGMREMLTTALQVHLALVGVMQNEIVKRLAGWGAILAIPTVIFSLYGMNFQGMPELSKPYGYPVVLGVTLLASVVMYRRLKQQAWV
jgi:magnesium transporter